ncbi:carbon-nitrogen hydrolase [Niabella soli DSM 19437]|uniref:Omega-amidase YafV n=2 Tax=Niabella TaxID=379899 RepID=W0EZQ5_9BACT|nr:carbon-nitrogen hydrolase [Niabella soli DSM 19437]
MMSLQISLIQTDLHWEDKAANRAMLEQKIESIPHTQVVVLPEMFSTGFSMQPALLAETMEGPTVQWMKEVATKNKIILTGSLIIKEADAYYNRLIWMLPNGQYGTYDKRHLFAFANEDAQYTPGNKRLITSVNGWKLHMQVCYDLRFPVWARQSPPKDEDARETEYDVLVNVANWPQRRSLAWKTLLQARAIENQCFVVGVNRVGTDGKGIYHSGDSMVIDPLGEILYHKTDEEDIFTITLHKTKLDEVRTKFPFLRDADGFGIY